MEESFSNLLIHLWTTNCVVIVYLFCKFMVITMTSIDILLHVNNFCGRSLSWLLSSNYALNKFYSTTHPNPHFGRKCLTEIEFRFLVYIHKITSHLVITACCLNSSISFTFPDAFTSLSFSPLIAQTITMAFREPKCIFCRIEN